METHVESDFKNEALTVGGAVHQLQADVFNEKKYRVTDLEPIIMEWEPILQGLCRDGVIDLFQEDETLFTFALMCENLKRWGFKTHQIATVVNAYKHARNKELIPVVDLAQQTVEA